ncbi:MAG: hypothetical protein N2447_03690 [Thermoanaerobaculum sp.]|nr:hypothetical protein [Thermoanaerobaculum sp.]
MDGRQLLDWYSQHRRSFPWRTPFPRDPYLVLVAEVMLQQTQASRVAELLPRFLARFPGLEDVAAAGEDQVVAAFAGLGYYRRARLLHRLAQQLVQRGWPQDPHQLRQLPGLGPYTAAAVAAFAFGHLTPPVDGNLARIAARLLALPLSAHSPQLRRQATALFSQMAQSQSTPALFEALMDLGATVCRPVSPLCGQCPLAARCLAFQKGRPEDFPLPKPQRARETPTWLALWLENPAGEVLLRPITEPPLQGLWLPPLERGSGEVETRLRRLLGELGLGGEPKAVGRLSHRITHRLITVLVFRLSVPPQVGENGRNGRWVSVEANVPTSSLAYKIARLVAEAESQRSITYG